MSAVPTEPRLIVVVDLAYLGDTERWLRVLGEVDEGAEGRPVAVQVRAKELDESAFKALATRARAIRPRGPLVLNGQQSMAVALGYDGVHWPEAAIPPVPVDSTLQWRSAAVHSLKAVHAAERAGATALIFGSVFEPGSKRGTAVGLDALREICSATALPVYAIGGISAERVGACLAAGAAGVAALSGVIGAPAPARAVETYLAAAESMHA